MLCRKVCTGYFVVGWLYIIGISLYLDKLYVFLQCTELFSAGQALLLAKMIEICRFPLSVRGINRTGYSLFDAQGLIHTVTEFYQHLVINTDHAQGTVDGYCEDIKHFCRYLVQAQRLGLEGRVDDRISMIDRYLVDQWLAYERDVNNLGRRTRKRREAAVKKFCIWLSSENGGRRLQEHPYAKNQKLTTRNPMRQEQAVLNEALVEEILKQFYNECERVMWQSAYDYGLRISELRKFTKGAVDIAKQVYREARSRGYEVRYVPIDAPVKKKGGNEELTMPVFISTPALERIIEYHNSVDYMFNDRWDMDDPDKPAFLTSTGRRWTDSNAREQLANAVKRSSLNIHVTPHIFRHSSCVSILTSTDHGKTHLERFFAAWRNLRHVNPSTTERYAHLPWDSLMKLNENDSVYDRALRLKKSTQLQARDHKERRGHAQ